MCLLWVDSVIKYFFMGKELVFLKFKNFVSFLILHKIFQTKNFVRVEYISLIFFPFFLS